METSAWSEGRSQPEFFPFEKKKIVFLFFPLSVCWDKIKFWMSLNWCRTQLKT